MSDLLSFTVARRQARAALLEGWLEGGVLRIYTGPRPASADTAIDGQLELAAVLGLSGDSAAGVWTGTLPDPVQVAISGLAAWGRFYDSAAATICDADLGVTGSGQAIEVDTANFVAGAWVNVTALSVEEG